MEANNTNANFIIVVSAYFYHMGLNWHKNSLTTKYAIKTTSRLVYGVCIIYSDYWQGLCISFLYFVISWYIFIFYGILI